MVSIDKNNKSPTITLTDRVVESLKTRRQRILNGQLNCILSPFTRFREDFVGIEQCCYYTITSFTKGKVVLI
nr:MAG TPA: Helicase ATPase [Crassvirales sp.]